MFLVSKLPLKFNVKKDCFPKKSLFLFLRTFLESAAKNANFQILPPKLCEDAKFCERLQKFSSPFVAQTTHTILCTNFHIIMFTLRTSFCSCCQYSSTSFVPPHTSQSAQATTQLLSYPMLMMLASFFHVADACENCCFLSTIDLKIAKKLFEKVPNSFSFQLPSCKCFQVIMVNQIWTTLYCT